MHEWHVAINRFNTNLGPGNHVGFLYQAKTLSDELPRMINLFERERNGMPDTWQYCSQSPVEPLEDNHLKCWLGKECRNCEYLAAIDGADIPDEAKDEAKAWTCATHILLAATDGDYIEQYLYDKSDVEFNNRMVESLMQTEDAEQ